MRGDFSRIRFNPAKHYTAVLEQQGRVALDADANEQVAIRDYLDRKEAVDVIGAYGAPEHEAGFAITVSQNEILIGAGRYYVEGLVCENTQTNLPYLNQPYLLNPSSSDGALLRELAQQNGQSALQVYLQVWQRLVTALDDPCLREPALGQADTTARLQTVWRVVASVVPPPAPPPVKIGPRPPINVFGGLREARADLAARLRTEEIAKSTVAKPAATPVETIGITRLPIVPIFPIPIRPIPEPVPVPTPTPAPTPAPDCCAAMYANKPIASTGTMTVSTVAAGSGCSCQPIPASGYQGIENQLYRVEIHQAGTESTATFKWSRENGSVVTSILNVSGSTIIVDSLGMDTNLGFQPNQWVEISDDTDLFGDTPNAPGVLYQIQSIDAAVASITLTSPVAGVDPNRNARVRRWDQSGASAGNSGVALSVGSWLLLENGIQVCFGAGTYQPGDNWTFAARTASGQIDWPPCASNGDLYQLPESATIYNAPLACIHWDTKNRQYVVEDCRRLFSPLTELSSPSASNALHVTDTNWTNDALITADVWVANGLTITLDGAPTSTITSAEFIVTIESIFDPFPFGIRAPVSVAGDFRTVVPSTFLRTFFTIDSTIAVNGSTITWTMPYSKAPGLQVLTVNAINSGLIFGASLGQYARVRVRLAGNAILSNAGGTALYLDGRALGQPAQAANGASGMALQLPSGAGEQSSDFESWFYVAPTLLIANLSVAYPAIFALVVNGVVTGAAASAFTPGVPPPAAINPIVTVLGNYRALVDTDVTLTLLDANGSPSAYATIESPITIHAGELSGNAAITLTGNPMVNGVPETVTITVTASISTAVGSIAGVPASFALTGGISQQVIQ